jgi:sugar phosphate permease
MIIVCLAWGVNFMCRNNVGVMIPSLRAEFHLSNAAAGSIASMFFLGYVIASIPGAFVLSKYGPRKFIATTIFIFSGITAALGAAGSVLQLQVLRFLLGIAESPAPIGITATLKNWFPPKERGRAMGVFTALSAVGITVGAPVTVWLMGIGGWRWGFYGMAIPGVVIGIIWLIFVRAYPSESPFCSKAEADYIAASGGRQAKLRGSLGLVDKCLRLRNITPIENKWDVFINKNVLTMAAIYFTSSVVTYGIVTWLPSFLVVNKHYSFVKMGWVAASCGLGQFFGDLIGGWMNDYVCLSRVKPTMLISTAGTAVCMWVVIHSPNNAAVVGIILFITGVVFHLGYPSYFAYNMG